MMNNDSDIKTVENYTDKTMVGRCKWFNSKNGYGFITVTYDDGSVGDDIFVHHNSIKVSNNQYKYLVLGEYVEFKILKSTDGKHKYYADEVSGIKGGKLMCETRLESKSLRNKYQKRNFQGEEQFENSDYSKDDDKNWSYVNKEKKDKLRSRGDNLRKEKSKVEKFNNQGRKSTSVKL